ncbi:MAG: DUF2280 domain-containing protein [Caulobacteraceae bacterium]
MGKVARLPARVAAFIVRALASFDPPAAVAETVECEFGLKLTPRRIELYDPEGPAGARLSGRWRALFAETRAAFLEEAGRGGIGRRAVRLRAFERMAAKAEAAGNLKLAADLHRQAAQETGVGRAEAHASDVEITGAMTAQEAAEAYADALASDE